MYLKRVTGKCLVVVKVPPQQPWLQRQPYLALLGLLEGKCDSVVVVRVTAVAQRLVFIPPPLQPSPKFPCIPSSCRVLRELPGVV